MRFAGTSTVPERFQQGTRKVPTSTVPERFQQGLDYHGVPNDQRNAKQTQNTTEQLQ